MENLLLCVECKTDNLNKEKKKYINKKCEHNKRKSDCIDCMGCNICIHKKRKSDCKECKGSSFCVHEKKKIIMY